ncbi:unnamed protein product [Dicrocoelium dendriticum]|nr:unnamed protein product [Dicrocoelium dendriticum]
MKLPTNCPIGSRGHHALYYYVTLASLYLFIWPRLKCTVMLIPRDVPYTRIKGITDSSKCESCVGDKSDSVNRFNDLGDRAVLVSELRRLRDQITALADSLDTYVVGGAGAAGLASGQLSQSNKSAGNEGLERGKEFDPLNTTRQSTAISSAEDTDGYVLARKPTSATNNDASMYGTAISSFNPSQLSDDWRSRKGSPTPDFPSVGVGKTELSRSMTPSNVHAPPVQDNASHQPRPNSVLSGVPVPPGPYAQPLSTSSSSTAPPYFTAPSDSSSSQFSNFSKDQTKPTPPAPFTGTVGQSQPLFAPGTNFSVGGDLNTHSSLQSATTISQPPMPPHPTALSDIGGALVACGPPTMGPYGRHAAPGRPGGNLVGPPAPPPPNRFMFSPSTYQPQQQQQQQQPDQVGSNRSARTFFKCSPILSTE